MSLPPKVAWTYGLLALLVFRPPKTRPRLGLMVAARDCQGQTSLDAPGACFNHDPRATGREIAEPRLLIPVSLPEEDDDILVWSNAFSCLEEATAIAPPSA
mmetsp:Transcript_11862/g.26181  ORF Transcript_11862/g.26181 Transcript_11862/m.26181 type:complete len:101 (-) Transcript_11862:24-326(-)